MRTRSPFQSLKQEVISVVSLPDGGSVYFVSVGWIEPNISPVPVQEKQRKQAQITALILEAAETLAREKKISPEEARGLFFPSSEGTAIALNPLDYLNTEQKVIYFSLVTESEEVPLRVATLMMQYRLAYEIVVTEPAKAKSKQLSIKEPWFAVEVGSCLFKFDSFVVQITEPYDPESGMIGVTALPGALEVGATGFLLKPDRKTYVMGDPSWSEEQTRELSLENADGSESQISAIYKFYLRESGKLQDEVEPQREGKSQSKKQASLSSVSQTVSTGTSSIGESSPTASEMNGSVPKTLEAVPIG